MRLFRNAIAHANYSFNETSQLVTFWNFKQRTTEKNFEVEINFNDLAEFTAEVGKYYINEVRPNK